MSHDTNAAADSPATAAASQPAMNNPQTSKGLPESAKIIFAMAAVWAAAIVITGVIAYLYISHGDHSLTPDVYSMSQQNAETAPAP